LLSPIAAATLRRLSSSNGEEKSGFLGNHTIGSRYSGHPDSTDVEVHMALEFG
jgi:hypothetical protein